MSSHISVYAKLVGLSDMSDKNLFSMAKIFSNWLLKSFQVLCILMEKIIFLIVFLNFSYLEL